MTIAPPNPPFIRARHYREANEKPLAVCMHGTVSHDDPGTARQIANWWAGPTSPETSAQYIRDPRETIQCVGDHDIAFHCGHNKAVIGYELCDEQVGPANRWFDEDSVAILKGAARDVARLCAAYDIEPRRPSVAELKAKGPHGVYGHNDSRLAFGNTTHTDPRDFPWDYFMRLVKTEYDRLLGLENQPVPAPVAPRIITGVKIAEISSKWDRPSATLRADIAGAAEWADIILLTEVYDRRKALAGMQFPGFSLLQNARDDRAEVAVLVRTSRWTVKTFEAKVIGPDPGPGNRVIAAIACLVHKDGTRFMVSISHLPSGVEFDWSGSRARAYRAAVTEFRRLHYRTRQSFKPHGEAAFADWNLDLHKPWVRAWIKSAWPGLTVVREGVIPKGGTHGPRLIDWFIRRGYFYIATWRIMPATAGSDHRSIRVAGHINRKK